MPGLRDEALGSFWLPAAAGVSPAAAARPSRLEQFERDALLTALEASRWNVSQAARMLGITRATLRYRIEKHGISMPD